MFHKSFGVKGLATEIYDRPLALRSGKKPEHVWKQKCAEGDVQRKITFRNVKVHVT
jgi:hypothetical protein